MKITTLNVRGLNAPNKKIILKQNLNKFESNIILLQETKLNKIEGINLGKKLGNWSITLQEVVGASRGLGFIWNHRKVTVDILNVRNNWISGTVKSLKSNLKFILVNFYGPTSNLEKKETWEEINIFMNDHKNSLILIGGDFNTIPNLNEKVGGTQQISQASKEF